jgi:hypothetical protein
MANTKITALTEDTTPTSDDLVVTVNDPAGTPASRKVSIANMSKAVTPEGTNIKSTGEAGGNKFLREDGDGTSSWQAIPGGGDALVASPLSQFAATTSAQLAGVISDETGTDKVVFNTSPTLVTPVLGAATGTSLQLSGLTASEMLITDASKNIASAPVATYPSLTELSYAKGVTSAIQTQLNAKQASGATLSSLEGLTLNAGDLLYATAADTLVDLPIGTANQELRVNAGATAPEWYTPSASGGQTTYDAIVAPSGGDYTTLGAAITAASAGWSIFVKEGTYAETTITTSLANLKIVGENPKTTTLTIAALTLTFSGAGLTFENMGCTITTGSLVISGANAIVRNLRMDANNNATTTHLTVSGAKSLLEGLRYDNTTTTAMTTTYINFASQYGVFTNSFIKASVKITTANQAVVLLAGNFTVFKGNTLESTATTASSWMVYANTGVVIADNHFGGTTSTYAYWIYSTGASSTISGNSCYNGAIYSSGSVCTISGNTIYQSRAGALITCGAETTVTGNSLSGAGAGTPGVTSATTQNDDIVISGNMMRGVVTAVEIPASTNVRWIITGNQFSTTVTTQISDSGVGTYIANNLPENLAETKIVKRLANTSGLSVAVGDIVTLKSAAAGDEFTTTTTAGDSKVIGVATATIANAAYGYITTQGKVTTLKVDGTTDIAIGDYISAFTTVGIGQKASAGHTAIAIALEAYTANDSNGVIDALVIPPRYV